jgi:hypothetical protein
VTALLGREMLSPLRLFFPRKGSSLNAPYALRDRWASGTRSKAPCFRFFSLIRRSRRQSVLALARTNSDRSILAIISGDEFPTGVAFAPNDD